jgi:hypothetical protein
MNPREFIEELRKRYNQRGPEYKECGVLGDIATYITVDSGARWLELGCGSYKKGVRHRDEDGLEPIAIGERVKECWNATGVDITPVGKLDIMWRFIEGSVLEEEIWNEISDGYHVVGAKMLFTFFNSRRISPGFTPNGRSLYTSAGTPLIEKPLDDTDYFRGVDYLLTRSHHALSEGGIIVIDSRHVLSRSGNNYVPEIGFLDKTKLDYLTKKEWTVQWTSRPEC